MDKEKQDQMQSNSGDEKKRIVDYYKEQMEQLKKTIEMLTSELQKKVSIDKTADGVQINTFNTQNFINMTPPPMDSIPLSAPNSHQKPHGPTKVMRRRKLSEDGFELKLLDLESTISVNKSYTNLSLLSHIKRPVDAEE